MSQHSHGCQRAKDWKITVVMRPRKDAPKAAHGHGEHSPRRLHVPVPLLPLPPERSALAKVACAAIMLGVG